MLDFNFCVPTNFIFGKGTHTQAGDIMKELGYKRVLVNYGGNFLQETGLLDVILKSLKNSGLEVTELDGVLPNPRLSLVYQGIDLCRKENIDIVLAVGGGSTIDTCKAIAAGVPYEGDVWDYYMTGAPVLKALPIGVILTIPASGSESGCGSIITNEANGLKRGAGGPALYPQFAICNPELTYSLPTVQTACGIADMYTHVCERYFSNTPDTYIIDALDEGFFRSLMDVAPKLLADPNNYALRSEVMWMGTIAHNDVLGIGRDQDWATHDMGHELSGTYAFGIFPEDGNEETAALKAIEKTESFMKSIGMPVRLSQLQIDDSKFGEMAEKALIGKTYIGNFVRLQKEDIIKIYELAK